MQTENQIKADAVNEFVCSMIGALESGFIDSEQLTLAQLHRVAQNHVKDSFDIEIPHLTEQWGLETAKLCGFPVCGDTDTDTGKKPRLFYREEALNGSPWVPAPDEIEHILSVEDQLDDGDEISIEFKRVDMTDEEMDNLPDVD